MPQLNPLPERSALGAGAATSTAPGDTAAELAASPELASLRAIRGALDNTSRVARLADALRQKIIDGELPPGTQLAEHAVAEALGVSRNTLREAFRLLSHEGLLEHLVHRGVFVRTLGPADVREIYATRRVVECAAIEHSGARIANGFATRAQAQATEARLLDPVRAALADGMAAAERGAWTDVGTADLRFHSALAALAGSRHLDDLMRRMLAELRLAFHVMADPQRFHEPYLRRNAEITRLLERGDRAGATAELRSYLDTAEAQLIDAMTGSATGRS